MLAESQALPVKKKLQHKAWVVLFFRLVLRFFHSSDSNILISWGAFPVADPGVPSKGLHAGDIVKEFLLYKVVLQVLSWITAGRLCCYHLYFFERQWNMGQLSLLSLRWVWKCLQAQTLKKNLASFKLYTFVYWHKIPWRWAHTHTHAVLDKC